MTGKKKVKLTKKQLSSFQECLLSLRRQISQVLSGSKEAVKATKDSASYSQHQADGGTDTFEQTICLELSGKEMKVLRLIDRALEKIEEGTYGICDITEEVIPLARLEAIPYAIMTVQAQEKVEKSYL